MLPCAAVGALLGHNHGGHVRAATNEGGRLRQAKLAQRRMRRSRQRSWLGPSTSPAPFLAPSSDLHQWLQRRAEEATRGRSRTDRVAPGMPTRGGRAPRVERGAGLGLQPRERDQGVLEAFVHVGEVEEVVQQPLHKWGRTEATQRVLRLWVVQQLGEGDEHPAQLHRTLGHDLRGDGGGGLRRCQAAH
jgi:hypothetical protein